MCRGVALKKEGKKIARTVVKRPTVAAPHLESFQGTVVKSDRCGEGKKLWTQLQPRWGVKKKKLKGRKKTIRRRYRIGRGKPEVNRSRGGRRFMIVQGGK